MTKSLLQFIIFFALILFICSGCDPFGYDHKKITNCTEALSYHNTKNRNVETAGQWIEENLYRNLNGANVSFVKDTANQIFADVRIDWSDVEKFDTVTVENVKFYSSHIYFKFSGGAYSHVACFLDRDYRFPRGFHMAYKSEPIRKEILDQICELELEEITVSTRGFSTFSENKIVRKNISYALNCLREL